MGKQTRCVFFSIFNIDYYGDDDFSSTKTRAFHCFLLFDMQRNSDDAKYFRLFLLLLFFRCKCHNTQWWKCEFLSLTLQHIHLCDIACRHKSLNSFIGFTTFRLTQKETTQTDTRFVWQSLKLMKFKRKLLHRQITFIQFYIKKIEGIFFWSIENDLTGKWNLPFDSFTFPCNQF